MTGGRALRGGIRLGAGIALAALVAVAAWWVARAPGPRGGAGATLSLLETLGGADTVGWARAHEPRPFVFPADHGPHPDFRTEWWYLTGNLWAADGRRFGVQLTFFRSALAPADPPAVAPVTAPAPASGDAPALASADAPPVPSSWRTRQAWMAHLAVTDADGRRFRAFERFARGAAGLAGASSAPLRVWLGDWTLASARAAAPSPSDTSSPAVPSLPDRSARPAVPAVTEVWPLVARAAHEGTGLELELTPVKPVVLQGERGLSRKGPEPGNASYYYTFPRLAAEGLVTLDGVGVPVTGLVWLDREWSTSALAEGLVGWDWFALQLDDGRDVMVYRLRRADGSADPWSAGSVASAAGPARRLVAGDFAVEPTGTWTSPVDGAVYPSGWRVRIPSEGLDLLVRPVLDDQELNLTFRYWEGAVDVLEADSDARLGAGYVELTGYAGAGPPGRGEDGGR